MLGLLPVILGYVPLTIGMALAAMAGALILASLMAVERVIRVPVLDAFVQLFISFFRGTPLLVQLFLFFLRLAADSARSGWHQRRDGNDHGADAAFFCLYGRKYPCGDPRC